MWRIFCEILKTCGEIGLEWFLLVGRSWVCGCWVVWSFCIGCLVEWPTKVIVTTWYISNLFIIFHQDVWQSQGLARQPVLMKELIVSLHGFFAQEILVANLVVFFLFAFFGVFGCLVAGWSDGHWLLDSSKWAVWQHGDFARRSPYGTTVIALLVYL